jgi:hypothetical protein
VSHKSFSGDDMIDWIDDFIINKIPMLLDLTINKNV